MPFSTSTIRLGPAKITIEFESSGGENQKIVVRGICTSLDLKQESLDHFSNRMGFRSCEKSVVVGVSIDLHVECAEMEVAEVKEGSEKGQGHELLRIVRFKSKEKEGL